ncbi:MAG: septum formation inhibitor Maf [Thermoanaerobacteraceae bacterium]|nr:septum formation inhibitor Maf [Thermoanaerobacteraceae bacterium]
MSKSIILASASPRRQQLLSQLGLEFSVEPSCLDENLNIEMDFGSLAAEMAFKKAMAVAKKHNKGLVIGADTIVVLGDRILGKPSTFKEAEEMLNSLSGRWHRVYTGLSLVDAFTKRYISDFEESRVKFKDLSSLEIQNYIKTGEPMDKAGAYGIQGIGALIVEKIEGDYYNIVGLPLFKLNKMLAEFDIKIL